ncbi:MAG TPA: YceI family protein [Terriglobales bacterium]|nr:YceI family protein [Terriglobales bacterium]
MSRGLRALCFLLLLSATLAAQERAIDPPRSTVTVHVGKAGVFSAFGHGHEVRGPIAQGSVDASGADPKVEVLVRAADLKVLDPDLKPADRAEVQSTMLGPKVLDAERFPDIRFRSTRAQREGDGWKIEGELTLHGETHPVMVRAREAAGHYTASANFRQTTFGITPVTAGGGGVKVKDELQLDFSIALR